MLHFPHVTVAWAQCSHAYTSLPMRALCCSLCRACTRHHGHHRMREGPEAEGAGAGAGEVEGEGEGAIGSMNSGSADDADGLSSSSRLNTSFFPIPSTAPSPPPAPPAAPPLKHMLHLISPSFAILSLHRTHSFVMPLHSPQRYSSRERKHFLRRQCEVVTWQWEQKRVRTGSVAMPHSAEREKGELHPKRERERM